jgi:hypothetical protein
MTAACAGSPVPLWDATVDGETDEQREYRHEAALRICARCPIRRKCRADVDPRVDDGVWGGEVLPTIHDSDRRSPYVGGFPPERVGRVLSGNPGALVVCDDCGRAMVPKSMPRHLRTAHAVSEKAA